MKLKYFAILIYFLAVTGLANAAALKVTPAEIKIKIATGETFKKEILVENPDANVALYEVYPDNFSDWIKIKPSSFTLESEETKKISLEIEGKQEGIFTANISVVAKPLSNKEFKAASGVKIPIEITIKKKRSLMPFASILEAFKGGIIYVLPGLILIILSVFILLKEKSKKTKAAISAIFSVLALALFLGYARPDVLKRSEEQAALEPKIASPATETSGQTQTNNQNQPSQEKSSEPKTEKAYLILNFGEGAAKNTEVEFKKGMTAFNILKEGAGKLGLILKSNKSEMGSFVDAIGETKGGQDGKYWIYYVNGVSAQIASDKNQIKAGDRVEWKFEKPNF